jgi:predicted dehydrogenase
VGKPLKVGIIGCGAIIAQYLTNFRKLDQIELVAVADLDPARARLLRSSTTASAPFPWTNSWPRTTSNWS